MGEIPSFENMISAIITSPENVEDLEADTAFDIKLQVSNLVAGAFTNPDITYYTAPQRLEGGKIIGHVHVSILLSEHIWAFFNRFIFRSRFKTSDKPTRTNLQILKSLGFSRALTTLAITMED